MDIVFCIYIALECSQLVGNLTVPPPPQKKKGSFFSLSLSCWKESNGKPGLDCLVHNWSAKLSTGFFQHDSESAVSAVFGCQDHCHPMTCLVVDVFNLLLRSLVIY